MHCLASQCVHLVLCTVLSAHLHNTRFYLDPMTDQITVCSHWLTDIGPVYSVEGISHNGVMIVYRESLYEYDYRALCVARFRLSKIV